MKRITISLALILFSICRCTNGDSVYVWSNDGTIRKFDSSGVALPFTSTNLSGWNGPVGLALDNAGNLYAGCPGDSGIHKFAASGSGGSTVGGDDSVSGLAFDHNGYLHATSPNWLVLSKLNYVTNSFDPSGHWQHDTTASTVVNLSYPVNLAFDSIGNIYVPNPPPPAFADYPQFWQYAGTIQKFSANLSFIETFATNLNGPWGLAFDSEDNLYVASADNTILRFTSAGVGSVFATATNGLSDPKGLAFDSSGNIYVANSGTGTIQKFTPDGNGSVFASGLDSPTSLAVFPGLNIWSATPIKIHPMPMANGGFGLVFASTPGLSFAVLSTTNLALANWVAAGVATETYPGSGFYEFRDPQVRSTPQIYYRIMAQ